jgi:hypothetical protein
MLDQGRIDVYFRITPDEFFGHRKSALQLKKWKIWPKDIPKEAEITLEREIMHTTLDNSDNLLRHWDFNKINKIPKVYFDKIIEVCRNNDIRLTVVFEPSTDKMHDKFVHSPLHAFIEDRCRRNGARYIDINDYDHYPDSAFSDDGLHLKRNWNNFYLFSLNRNIFPLLPDLKIGDK